MQHFGVFLALFSIAFFGIVAGIIAGFLSFGRRWLEISLGIGTGLVASAFMLGALRTLPIIPPEIADSGYVKILALFLLFTLEAATIFVFNTLWEFRRFLRFFYRYLQNLQRKRRAGEKI